MRPPRRRVLRAASHADVALAADKVIEANVLRYVSTRLVHLLDASCGFKEQPAGHQARRPPSWRPLALAAIRLLGSLKDAKGLEFDARECSLRCMVLADLQGSVSRDLEAEWATAAPDVGGFFGDLPRGEALEEAGEDLQLADSSADVSAADHLGNSLEYQVTAMALTCRSFAIRLRAWQVALAN